MFHGQCVAWLCPFSIPLLMARKAVSDRVGRPAKGRLPWKILVAVVGGAAFLYALLDPRSASRDKTLPAASVETGKPRPGGFGANPTASAPVSQVPMIQIGEGKSVPAYTPHSSSAAPVAKVPPGLAPDAVRTVPPSEPLAARAPRQTPAPPMGAVAQTAVASPGRPAKLAGTERALRLQELLREVGEEKDERQAERTWLTIAGYYAGAGDWEAAREVYERLKTSPSLDVRQSVGRNLDITLRRQAILAEANESSREWQELELAAVHQGYGHEKAAKRLLRALESSATQESVRQLAAQRLATYVSPALPLPPAAPSTP